MSVDPTSPLLDRRSFLNIFSALGLGGTLLPGVLWAELAHAQSSESITPAMIESAEKLAGLSFTPEEREDIARNLHNQVNNYQRIREVPLPNDVPPALQFNPILPGMTFDMQRRPIRFRRVPVPEIPADLEEVAFWPVLKLARAIEAGKLSSEALTRMYIARLKRFDPTLHCVITFTEDLALDQARRADHEIASGRYRGPLHGIPWGAKDLLAVRGYPTTWGAMPYKDQMLDLDATVVQRLNDAGAVLVAKLTLGALAMGDRWYGERTRNPWNPERGSSGSSAGPAAAVAAGLVAFAIGSETNGSIMSPSRVCGVTGLRPTFGRVSRHGAMALSWSMDKLGPMARTAEDCAAVLDAIAGPDGLDLTVHDIPFNYDAEGDLKSIRVGVLEGAFDGDSPAAANGRRTLERIRGLGFDLHPVRYPDLPYSAMGLILTVEAAAAFDEFTRSNRDDELVSQERYSWPNIFRSARMVPAVEYIQANRVRTRLMQAMHEIMSEVDVIVTPPQADLYAGNFTGHPMLAFPNGFEPNGMPTSIALFGRLFEEGKLLALASAIQATETEPLRHPRLAPS
jgi:Asp-tRNA(Asn)/Glu-tRNA(Gln) amidotransferase A subunit family amidase